MTYSISNNEIARIAEELGLKVTFNSATPGVLNTTTGEHKKLDTYFESFFQKEDFKKVVEMKELKDLKLHAKEPKKNEKELEEYLFFSDVNYVLAG